MTTTNIEETTIVRLIELGTVTYEVAGWGTGELAIKCRSNTKCEKESLNKALISMKADESSLNKDNIEEYVIRELGKKLAENEVHVLTEEDKKYNIAKRKFKAWKNTYKSENRAE